jgi:hypothetical protein
MEKNIVAKKKRLELHFYKKKKVKNNCELIGARIP